MISHTHRCIFVHQRKVAGTSIIRHFGIDPSMAEWHLYNDGVLTPEWRTRGPLERSYLSFSTVRNPFDRLVSAWLYLPSTRSRPLIDVLRDPPRTGHDFRHLARCQHTILVDPATGGLIVDELIRYESLETDFDRIRQTLGLPHRSLDHFNATRREHDYRPYFDGETRALATEMFRRDLDAFGYEF